MVPSVTTVLKKLDKPGVLQWGIDNTAAFAVANLDRLHNMTEAKGYGFLRWYWSRSPFKDDRTDIRNYSDAVLHDAAELGTLMHDWVAAEHGAQPYPDVTDAPAFFWQMVAQWDAWVAEHNVKPILTETTFWSEQYGYAGTCDGLWEVDGIRYLLDVKTSRNTWDEHYMQLAALGACEEMLTEDANGQWVSDVIPSFSAYALLHIRPQDTDTEGNYKAPFIKLKVLDLDEMPEHFEAFLGLLKVSHAQNKVKDIRKAAVNTSGF